MNKEFSALEATQAFFDTIKEKDKNIGAFLSLNERNAIQQAEEVDLAIAKDETIGPLAGITIALKDNMLLKGLPATAGSKILEHYTASYDGTVVEKLKKERAVFLGKTNLDEFAMGSSTENSAFQKTKNPHDTSRVPGGSSGGSAAAVAADMAIAALGSDTGGSIREPAAFSGVVGFKPSYGAVSRSGLIAMSSSLDQIGPLTKTVEDAAILYDAIRGHDPLDATSKNITYKKPLTELDTDKLKNLVIGLPEEYFIDGLSPAVSQKVNEAIETFTKLGIRTKKVSLPHTKYALSCYYIIMPAEVSSNLARFDGIRYARTPDLAFKNLLEIYLKQRGEGFGPEVKRRIILGTFVLSSGYYDAYYAKAQKVRTLIAQDFDRAFEEVDVILTPVTPTPAFKFGEKTDDPLAMYLSDIFTIPANLAGIPAISIPVDSPLVTEYSPENLPVGFQLMGSQFHEDDVLGLGQLYEQTQIQ